MKLKRIFLNASLVIMMVVGSATASAAGPKGPSVIDVAESVNAATGEFATLLFALEATGLKDVLDNRNGQVTVFAPTDEAFGKLPPELLAQVVSDLPTLTNVLLYHVAKGRRDAGDVIDSEQIRMVNGDFIGVDFDGTTVTLIDNGGVGDDATVIGPNVGAANGIIHVISEVLVP